MPTRSALVVTGALVMALAGGIALGAGVLDGAEPEPASAARVAPQETPADTAARAVADAYRAGLGETPLAGTLTGSSVSVVTLPGADTTTVDRVTATLTSAGATVVGTLALTDRMVDPADRQFVVGVAEQSLADVKDTPTDGLGNYEIVGAALGRAIAAKETTPPDAPAQTVVSALGEAGLLTTEKAPASRAQLTVVVTGEDGDYSGGRGELVATLAAGIDAAGVGTVVAGPVGSGSAEGAVEAVRASAAAETVTTVDVVDVPFGDIVLVTALQKERAGTAGHYGTAGAADGAVPPAA
ncbi:copper transporter [Mumia zhuanghuii]|uniref:Copper transporter n=1 Tax=Mumia zhuanghuii TaxID=2585211 RepID=A0A5Q6RNS5_9ACTN|nr:MULTISPECIES: copper transporter [Mumia]KAA1419728.1 copper transporter [Mumia zhuanghuii]